MKRLTFYLIIFVIFFISLRCANDSITSDSDTGFRKKPNTLEKKEVSTDSMAFNIDFDNTNYKGVYAIIYEGDIDEENHVGFAISQDPIDDNSFSMKIFFKNTTIEEGPISINSYDNYGILLKESGILYSTNTEPITIQFTKIDDNIYTLASADTVSLKDVNENSKSLQGFEITAIKASTDI